MTRNKLGLPIEYNKLHEYFDAFNISDDADIKNDIIKQLLKKHQVKTVLDLTCGTGSQVFFLAKHGYQVTGADLSSEPLKQARQKARKEKIDVKFYNGDMRTLKIGLFDAVITISNAVGHLTKAGFEKAMRSINKNLKEGGIYIFDILNLEAMTDTAVANLANHMYKKVGDSQIYDIQFSTIDRITGRLTSYDSVMTQKNAEAPKRFHHQFSLQIFTAKEIRDMLHKAGFETLDQCGMDGSKFIATKTLSILTTAKKRSR